MTTAEPDHLDLAIVGQATHIVDLCRYLCGEADLSSIAATTVEGYEKPGKLSKLFSEEGILSENRIPRVTNAMWKWKSGATGILVHAVALHSRLKRCYVGVKYDSLMQSSTAGDFDTELTVLADGWKIKLVDPYGTARLYVRRPESVVEGKSFSFNGTCIASSNHVGYRGDNLP